MPFRISLIALCCLLIALPAAADSPPQPSLAPGDTLKTIDIADQHGKAGEVDDGTQVLMMSRDMTANKLAKKAFMDKPAGYLEKHHAAYLIDVSGMPTFVTRMFAIPKMQKYPYRIFLDRDATLTAALPTHPKQVTVIELDGLKVKSVQYVDDADALVRAVEAH